MPGGSWLILIGQFFFKYRDLVSPVMVIAIALMQRPRLLFGSRHWDAVLDAAGVLLALSGQILRAAVIGFAYIKRGGKDRQVYADTLVQEGFFAHCRNPLYVGNCLILIGYFVILNTPAGYLIGVPFFAFLYWTIVLAEEDFLRRKFESSYVSYCHAVNRFVPDLRGLRKTLDGMKYDWRRLIRKEYGTLFTTITVVLGLIAWEHVDILRRDVGRSLLVIVLSLWLATTAAYVAARYAKKQGMLTSE